MTFETNDLRLTANDIGQLENAAEIIRFLARLGYGVDDATPLSHAALGLEGDDIRLQVKSIQLAAADRDHDIVVYLLVVRSVTMGLVQKIARQFRTRPELALLVLTVDYERLHFVLLDPVRESTAKRRLNVPFKQVIHPRTLTVDRRHPSSLALRVLQRFTYTEGESDLQWDKLRSAYTLAEWSEEYFNNRALFSDYYLNKRLTDVALSPAWGDDVTPIGRELFKRVPSARKDFAGHSEAQMRHDFYEPLFKLLGFDFAAGKESDSEGVDPDYYLYAPGDHTRPLAAAFTYVWNRSLDAIDTVRDSATPNEIPGALVVSTLETGRVPWVIATNGKLWRLYAAAADNKATNYYEVDLEEAFSAPDRVTALKYWWLFFRRAAFEGFLDDLRRFSADYAKELGQRLKNRVFEEIFPHFAAGLIADLRARGLSPDLPLVFQATLTFLYRLMFVAYAESLDLLPLYETQGYGDLSLHKLKYEVAEAGGTLEDEAPKKLRKAFAADATGLYARLQALFTAIDAGDPQINLPTYNGGLFSAETEAGRLLATCAIPDQHLALGLDRLCRDVDNRTQALVMIDFKSLGVRQLGSIYEGLLEFKLQIAGEKLAVVRQEGKEVYLPAAKAKGKNILAQLEKGDVYLQNDKAERKATGSYYTPDYIVKYIVEHTVGPVLQRKFAELEPKLREAQRRYREAAKVAQQKGEAPEKFWNSDEMQRLADACLDLKVLDPAMGSGHFLVQAVDYISDRLIVWLNGWSENPVWALLDRTRRDILEDMERQGVTIPAERLVRVALLKRAVLKRCIYGVDLNAMAVELAKVSLWLDAFTLGAPLSFLDHHLKQGNSLIGSRVATVQTALQGAKASLFASSQFTGVMLATDLMRQVSYLSDNTPAQVAASRTAYRSAGDHLAPFKRVLDVYTSRWFGNGPTKKGFEPALEFLQRGDVQAWLNHLTPDALPETDYMDARQVAATALAAAADKRFFHWELEFPEVYFAPSRPGGQDVQLREDAGFDAVVGNPPYDELSRAELGHDIVEIAYWRDASFSQPAMSNRTNLYRLFVVRSVELLAEDGHHGFIVPMSLLSDSFTHSTRRWLLTHTQLKYIDAFPQKDDPNDRVFWDAKLSTCIYLLQKSAFHKDYFVVRTHPGRVIVADSPCYITSSAEIFDFDPENCSIPILSKKEWQVATLLANSDVFDTFGSQAQALPGELMINSQFGPYLSPVPNEHEIVRGAHIMPYFLSDTAKQGESLYLLQQEYLSSRQTSVKAFHHLAPRVVYQRYAAIDNYRRLIATILPSGRFCSHTVGYLWLQKEDFSKYFFLALLNSTLLNWRFNVTSTNNNINGYEIETLPLPKIGFDTEPTRRDQASVEGQGRYLRCLVDGYAEIDEHCVNHLQLGEKDVIHDLLAFLAEQMIDLNKRKQAEMRRFLVWLEGRLAIIPKNGEGGIDSLNGKSILQNYLGDYQKGEEETAWEEFYARLHQNRRRFHLPLDEVKGEIEREYGASLAVLRPIKRQLARTDTLIDKIVYRLYGLSDAEIEIIERPQYEQALANARQSVVQDKTLSDEERIERLADHTLAATQRLQDRVNLAADEAALAAALPGVEWLTNEARTFLLGAEFDLRTRPEQLDFATVVVQYSKAVEQMLGARLFARFRAEGRYTAADCSNESLQKYMNGAKPPTLAVIRDILRSRKEVALRQFGERVYLHAAETIFGERGVAGLLDDKSAVELRNRAAHDTVLTRDDALKMREWALAILRLL